MSELKVNKVSPRSGTNLTIGDSGDTTNIVGTLNNNGSALLSLANGVDNRVITSSSANALNGEANLTFDGSTLGVNGAAIFNESGADKDFRVESDGNANMLFVDGGNNKIGIGTAAPDFTLSIERNNGPQLGFRDTSGGTDSKVWLMSGLDSDFRLQALSDNLGAGQVASIITRSGATVQTHQFYTADNERVRIHSNGVVAAANGIALGVGTANTASNVLDDYEEGTWTPVMTTSGGSLSSVAYGAYNKGWYTKVGRNVTVNFNVHLSSKGSNGSGAVRLSGYPFSSTTLLTASVYGSLYMYNGGVDQPCCTYGTWQNYVTIRYVNAAGGGEITWDNISNNSSWSGMMTFITNQ
jgi:hypothetical protein